MSRVRAWTCQRVRAGKKCGHRNPSIKRKCQSCDKLRPARKKPAHMVALNATYEDYIALNGGEHCGICGAKRKPGGKRLHRDHDHRTGKARGLLCFPCNSALRPYMDWKWVCAAADYLARTKPEEAE